MGVTRLAAIARHVERADRVVADVLAFPSPSSWGSWLIVRGRLQASRRDLAAAVALTDPRVPVVVDEVHVWTEEEAAEKHAVLEAVMRSRVDRVAVAARRVELNLDAVEGASLLRAVDLALADGEGSVGHLQALERIRVKLQPRVSRARAASRQ